LHTGVNESKKKENHILGLSAYYHDSAAALLTEGQIVAAAQEERFSRKKHDARFPRQATEYCLREAWISLADLDAIVFYDKPLVKFERLLETYLSYAPSGFRSFLAAMPLNLVIVRKSNCPNCFFPSITSLMRLLLFTPALSKRRPCCAWTEWESGQPLQPG